MILLISSRGSCEPYLWGPCLDRSLSTRISVSVCLLGDYDVSLCLCVSNLVYLFQKCLLSTAGCWGMDKGEPVSAPWGIPSLKGIVDEQGVIRMCSGCYGAAGQEGGPCNRRSYFVPGRCGETAPVRTSCSPVFPLYFTRLAFLGLTVLAYLSILGIHLRSSPWASFLCVVSVFHSFIWLSSVQAVHLGSLCCMWGSPR